MSTTTAAIIMTAFIVFFAVLFSTTLAAIIQGYISVLYGVFTFINVIFIGIYTGVQLNKYLMDKV